VVAQGGYHVSNLEVQAQNTMMQKWDITSSRHSPDAEALESYNTIYRAPLESSHCKAIEALFTACPTPPSELCAPMAIVPVGSIKVSMDSEAIVFWNVCRLNSRARRHVVAKLVGQERISLLCLQMTKLHDCNDALINGLLGSNFSYSFIPAIGLQGRILVAWKLAVWTTSHLHISANTLSLKVTCAATNMSWWLTTVYGP
jgi:hypothetical protein